MLLIGFSAWSQVLDTIFWNERKADLYYYGSNWVDSSLMSSPTGQTYLLLNHGVSNTICQRFVAFWQPQCYRGRTCVTDVPLSVVGIAAPACIDCLIIYPGQSYCILDSSIENRLPEYFQLYQQEGNSIVFKDEARWDTLTPQHAFQIKAFREVCCDGLNPYIDYDHYFPLYEAYFDKPVIVHDTFYVGGTIKNNRSSLI